MSKRQSRHSISNRELRWWRRVGNDLGCLMCRSVPFCDRCGVQRAEGVATFSVGPSQIEALRVGHLHLCGPCRERIHRHSGLVRTELTDDDRQEPA